MPDSSVPAGAQPSRCPPPSLPSDPAALARHVGRLRGHRPTAATMESTGQYWCCFRDSCESLPRLFRAALGSSAGLFLAVRLHWLALEILPLVRSLGRPRPDHRSKLFRRRVDPKVPTAKTLRTPPASVRACGRRGTLPLWTIPFGWFHGACVPPPRSGYLRRSPSSPPAIASMRSHVSWSRWYGQTVNSPKHCGKCRDGRA